MDQLRRCYTTVNPLSSSAEHDETDLLTIKGKKMVKEAVEMRPRPVKLQGGWQGTASGTSKVAVDIVCLHYGLKP